MREKRNFWFDINNMKSIPISNMVGTLFEIKKKWKNYNNSYTIITYKIKVCESLYDTLF